LVVSERWEVQNLRATMFVPKAVDLTSELWTRVTGVLPEVEERRAREGQTRIGGAVEGVLLLMISTPLQLDVHLGPLQEQTSGASGAVIPRNIAGEPGPLFGLLEAKLPLLFDQLSSVTRIAFAGTVLSRSPDIPASYAHLQKLLGSVKVQPDKMRDLLYRVNWPAKSDTGVDINRLTSWSSIAYRLFNALTLGGVAPIPSMAESYYVQLEFDINTVPRTELQFDAQQLKHIFPQLVQLARENLSAGEVVSQ
jgi:hypothetical protein